MDIANLTIEELEKRILAGGSDAVECVNAAEKLIFEDLGGADGSEEAATAAFILWRQGEIAISTERGGNLAYYKPYVQRGTRRRHPFGNVAKKRRRRCQQKKVFADRQARSVGGEVTCKGEKTMPTINESPIKEKDSYYVLRHIPTGLYVHELDLDPGEYDLEETILLDNPGNQGGLGPFRIYPDVGGMAESASAMPPGTDHDAVARQVNQEAREVIDWLNENDEQVAGAYEAESDYEYSDFELMLVEVEYTVKDIQPMAAVAAV
jgi:hypothetical protein